MSHLSPQGTEDRGGLGTILTAIRNLVAAVGNLGQALANIQGVQSRSGIASVTAVKTSAGRVCVVVVTTAGSAAGAIYDANQTSITTNPIFVIPNTLGVTTLNIPTNTGIVVAPGTGQIVTVSFS